MAYRKLQIGDKLFEYSVGSGIKIKSKGIKSFWVKDYILLGMTKDEYWQKKQAHRFDDDDDRYTWKLAISPQDVKNYLIKKGLANE